MNAFGGILFFSFLLTICFRGSHGRSVADDLLDRAVYDRHQIPATQHSGTNVTVKFRINDIDLREREEILELDMWITLTWTDPRLQWEAGVDALTDALRIRRDRVWVPDFTIYNNVYENSDEDHSSDNIIVYPSGMMLYVFPTKKRIQCVLDMTYWPYDRHVCKAKFGSWVYDGYKLNLTLGDDPSNALGEHEAVIDRSFQDGRDAKKFRTQWEIVTAKMQRAEKYYDCCAEPYPHVELALEVKRDAPAFYSIVQKPAFALSLLSTVVFLMPPGAAEKLVVGALSAILNIQFLTYVTDKVEHPPHHTPLIISFLTDQMIFSVIAVFLCALIVRLAKNPHPKDLPAEFRRTLTYAALGCCLGNFRSSERKDGNPEADDVELEDPLSGKGRRSGEGAQYAGYFSYRLLAAVLDRILFLAYFIEVIIYGAVFYSVLF